MLCAAIVARRNCIKSGSAEWENKWDDAIATLARDFLPSGSGFDTGTKVDLSEPRGMPVSNGESRVVLTASYHHMDENGGYDGWTDHRITVRPNLLHGFTLTISGRDRNDFKSYAHDVFTAALDESIVPMPDGSFVRVLPTV